jgi:hypothetical protein
LLPLCVKATGCTYHFFASQVNEIRDGFRRVSGRNRHDGLQRTAVL